MKRILIVEDDKGWESLCRELIKGADLTFARTLEQALELLRAERFDLVIADCVLPDCNTNCESMLTMIGVNAKGAPIAAITGRLDVLPARGHNAAEHKANVTTPEAMLAFIAKAERNAAESQPYTRQVNALANWVDEHYPSRCMA